VNVADFAVGTNDPVNDIVVAGLARLIDRGPDHGAVVRVNRLVEAFERWPVGLRVLAEDPEHDGRPVQIGGALDDLPVPELRDVLRFLQQGAFLFERRLCLPAIGDVLYHPEHVRGGAVAVADHVAGFLQPADRAVGPDAAMLACTASTTIWRSSGWTAFRKFS
jgi:hypothetical protein